ncbi:MAG: ABC transporter ATP-binding protein [Lachnospirales bacterium]
MNTFEDEEYKKKFNIDIWRKVFKFTKNCRKDLVVLVFWLFTVAALDASFPLISRYAIDNFVENRDLSTIYAYVLVTLGAVVLIMFCVRAFVYYSGKVEHQIIRDIRKASFENLQELSFSYYDVTPIGWIMARTVSDVVKIGNLLAWGFADLFYGFVVIVFYIVAMLFLNPMLARYIIIAMPIVFILGIFFQSKILRGQRAIKRINSTITALYNEGLAGAKTTKTITREKENFEEFHEVTGDFRSKSIKVVGISSLFFIIIGFIGNMVTAFTLAGGAKELEVINTTLTIGTLSAFILYIGQVFEPIQNIARIFSELQSAQASGERTISLIETKPAVTDTSDVIEKYGTSLNPKYENFETLHGDVEFKNVSFSYIPEEPILKDFSLKVNKGEQIALVGETGSGKSTIINLICRFYEPVSGEILIDGENYKDRSQLWLHSNLAYVLQTPHLFSGSIMENIRYGKLDATDEEVIEAAKKVDAYDFIMNFEDGFNTDVGEGGAKLSQGERQLVSFARAIIGEPAIFVLD